MTLVTPCSLKDLILVFAYSSLGQEDELVPNIAYSMTGCYKIRAKMTSVPKIEPPTIQSQKDEK